MADGCLNNEGKWEELEGTKNLSLLKLLLDLRLLVVGVS